MKNKIIILNDDIFENYVIKTNKIFLIYFWAEWCGPCKMMTPIMEEIANEFYGKLTIGKINIDENKVTTLFYNIKSIPNLLLYRNGEVVLNKVGMLSKGQLEELLKINLTN